MEFSLHPALLEDGRFQVKHCIGSGGFGIVYAAFDTRTKANVALKWLRNSDAGTIARFKREFRALADVAHPNLVGFRELITVAGEWFFTMDLVNGVDLIQWVRPASPQVPHEPTAPTASMKPEDAFGSTVVATEGLDGKPRSAPVSSENDGQQDGALGGKVRPLCTADLPRLRATLEQLAEGLHALHSVGLLHRDVKPSNVLVTREGRVVLLDFGLVTEMGQDDIAQTKTGNIVGTPAYMSPEQAMGSSVGPASDWYSVGAILFQALTGHVPFEDEAAHVLIQKQLRDAPRPNALVRGVPRELSQLCTELLARAPEQRPHYKELLERLRAAIPRDEAVDGTRLPASNPSLVVAPITPRLVGSSLGQSHSLDPLNRSIAFVGRETHLWALDEAAEEVERSGKTVVSLVYGTSGIGKSALVRRFLDTYRAERPEAVILEGRCYERESMPYKALDSLVDALCRYLQRLPDVEAAKLLPRERDLAALARLFPVFLQFEVGNPRRRSTSRSIDAVQERRRAFEALRELFTRVADKSPTILFIDDLQWGDGDSEPLLTALFQPPDPPPLLLIVAYRAEDAATSPLVKALRKMTGGSSIEVCEIPVAELSPEAARGLASSLLGSNASPRRVDEIARESFGSPLFLRQLAAIVEHRRAQQQEAGRNGSNGANGSTKHEGAVDPFATTQLQSLPPSRDGSARVDLATLLSYRIEALEPPARRLLETLAVAGKPLPLALAARAAGIEADAQGVLATLRAETLVRSRGGEAQARDEVEIYHDKIRETVLSTLSEEELKTRHRRLARALSSTDGDAEMLAAHFMYAGEKALAAEYAEKAAERATAALAFSRAAEMYEMALDANVGSTAGKSGGLYVKLAEALLSAGRSRDAADRFLQAAKAALRIGAGKTMSADALELRRRAAEQLLFCGRIDEGLKVVEQILSAMKMRAPATRWGAVLSLLWRRIVLRLRGIRFKERNADQLAREHLIRIDTCYSIALGLGMVDPVRGADFQTRYLLLALSAGEPLRVAKGLSLEAAYRAADGARQKPAISYLLAKARALADKVNQPHAQALTTLMSGVSRVILGEFREAIPLCDQAGTELREKCTGVAWELDNAAFFAGFSLLACGRVRDLAQRLPELIENARSRGDLYGEVLLRLQCAWFVALARDDVAKAEAELAVVTDEWSKDRFLLQNAWRLVNAIEVHLYKDEPERAIEEIDLTWQRLEESMFLRAASMRARMHNAVGRAALAAYDATKDEAHLDRAARAAGIVAPVKWPLARGFAHLLEAGIHVRRGQRDAAIRSFEEASTELDEQGARLYAMAARARLGAILGGARGNELVTRSFAEMIDEHILVPAKMVRVFAPGPEISSPANHVSSSAASVRDGGAL